LTDATSPSVGWTATFDVDGHRASVAAAEMLVGDRVAFLLVQASDPMAVESLQALATKAADRLH
jgi:hypothetical protein